MKHKHFAAAQYATHSSVHLLYGEFSSACVVVVEWGCAGYRGMLNESLGVPRRFLLNIECLCTTVCKFRRSSGSGVECGGAV